MSPCLQNPTSCLQQGQVGPTPMGRQPSPKSQGSFGGRKLVRASSLERGLHLFCDLGCKATSFRQEMFIPHGSIQSAAGLTDWQRGKRNGFGLTVKVAGVILRLQLGDELSLLPQQPVPVQMEEEGMVLHLMCTSCQAEKPVSGPGMLLLPSQTAQSLLHTQQMA